MSQNLLIDPANEQKPRKLAIVAFADAEVLDITGPHEVFALAKVVLGEPQVENTYSLFLLADQAGPFSTSSGLQLVADASWRDFDEELDTLLVAGGPGATAASADQDLLQWLTTQAKQVRRLGSICNGALVVRPSSASRYGPRQTRAN